MVYCTKCGEKNPDDAHVCSKCGEPLYRTPSAEGPAPHRPRSARRSSDVCYGDEGEPGIPRVILFLIGAALLVGGLSLIAEFWFDISAEVVSYAFLLLVGLVIIWYGLTRYGD